jgi:hypothetical protein
MANITIKDLTVNTTGVNLLNHSMGFVQDLSEDELTLKGGGFWDWLGGGWGGAGGQA